MNIVIRVCSMMLMLSLCACATKSACPAAQVQPNVRAALTFNHFRSGTLPEPEFALVNPGSSEPIDYAQYGTLKNVGRDNYSYVITNLPALQQAIGEGIFPNDGIVEDDPAYQQLKEAGVLETSPWDALDTMDPRTAFFVWTRAPVETGVKTYYTALALEKANLIVPAIKAHYAVLLNFTRSALRDKDQNLRYLAPESLAAIHRLCRTYPQLGWRLEGASWTVRKHDDGDCSNDLIAMKPGRFVQEPLIQPAPELQDLAAISADQRAGADRMRAAALAAHGN